MSTGSKLALGGAAGFLLLTIIFNVWIALLVVVGLPAAAYFMLDESQRRRLRGTLGRKQLGR